MRRWTCRRGCASAAIRPPGWTSTRGSLEPLLQVAARPKAAARLEPGDVLVDAMRGRYSVWTRIRVNLRRVPEAERPPQEPPDPDYDPSAEWNPPPSAP